MQQVDRMGPRAKRPADSFNDEALQRLTAWGLVFAAGLLWFVNDGPLKFLGLLDLVRALEIQRGTQVWGGTWTVGTMFVILAALGSSGQVFLTAWWGRLTRGGLRGVLVALLLILGWVLPSTCLDVAITAAGVYTRFVPLPATVEALDWWVMTPATVEAIFGSVVAQQVCTIILFRLLRREA